MWQRDFQLICSLTYSGQSAVFVKFISTNQILKQIHVAKKARENLGEEVRTVKINLSIVPSRTTSNVWEKQGELLFNIRNKRSCKIKIRQTCKTMVPTYFTTKAPPITMTPNERAKKNTTLVKCDLKLYVCYAGLHHRTRVYQCRASS